MKFIRVVNRYSYIYNQNSFFRCGGISRSEPWDSVTKWCFFQFNHKTFENINQTLKVYQSLLTTASIGIWPCYFLNFLFSKLLWIIESSSSYNSWSLYNSLSFTFNEKLTLCLLFLIKIFFRRKTPQLLWNIHHPIFLSSYLTQLN